MAVRRFAMFIAAIMFITLTGCAMTANPPAGQGRVEGGYLTVQDAAGRKVVLPSKPQRMVVLSPSFLDLLYTVDGTAVGRPSSRAAVPQAALPVAEVGYVYNISLEKVAALQPDLVIALQGMHEKLIPVLESSNIPVILLKYKTYEDTAATIELFGSITGNKDKAQQVIRAMEAQTGAVTAKLPDRRVKTAIIHATAKSVTLELENTIAGSMAQKLRLINVAAGAMPLEQGGDSAPYSMEKLVEADPDIIFVVTMGETADIQKRLKSDVESSPAWASLRAVQDKQLHFLPSDLFLLNPGLRSPEALEYMAKLVYPEVYGHVK